jgi:EpsI family protein
MNYPRALALLLVLAITAIVARPVEPRAAAALDLRSLPYSIGAWSGTDDEPLDRETAAQLGADDYLTRVYSDVPLSLATALPAASLYVAYYASQRPGVSIHSPLHCLPGTGWEPIAIDTVAIAGADGTAGSVRQLVVRKHLDRAAVIYWYQLHGRIVANEVKSKMFLLADSVWLRRSDAALVRVVVPVTDTAADAATSRALSFARDLVPSLAKLL